MKLTKMTVPIGLSPSQEKERRATATAPGASASGTVFARGAVAAVAEPDRIEVGSGRRAIARAAALLPVIRQLRT
jgi:hypothetical protein